VAEKTRGDVTLSAPDPLSDSAKQEKPQEDEFAALRKRIEAARTSRPLFPVTEVEEGDKRQHYLALRFDQLEKLSLCSASLEEDTEEGESFALLLSDTFLCFFHQEGQAIQFRRRQTEYRAEQGTPELKSIQQSFPDTILAVVPIPA
jgi:hypothetical protein